jgi:urea carboxylase-associated protein 2
MASMRVRTQPTVPATDAVDLPPGVDADRVVWAEVVAAGGSTSKVLARGTHLRIEDSDGDGCVGILLHRAGQTAERLNIADTVKVQWQAYPSAGSILLSDLGRVMMSIVEDSSGRHDAFCGTSNRLTNGGRYGDGEADGPSPNGRDRFAVALIKQGMDRRDVAPNLNLFKGVTVADDGTITLDPVPARPGTHVVLRAEMDVVVTLVNVPHVLDDRDAYTVTPISVLAWRGEPAGPDDPVRNATPEGLRAFLNTEDLYGASGSGGLASAAGSGGTAS